MCRVSSTGANDLAIKPINQSSTRRVAGRVAGRKFWRKIHLYIALTVGFMFAFSGLTGSLLVFYQDIDEYLNPELLTVELGNDYAPLSDIIAVAQASMPGESNLQRVYFPRHVQAAIKLRFSSIKVVKGDWVEVMINPYTGEILGQREYGSYLMSFLYKLHYTLLSGDTGKSIIGGMGLLLLTSLLSGLYLWWPRLSKLFQALSFKRSISQFRFIYDLHKTLGIYISIVVIAIAFSGVYMIFPNYVKPLVALAFPLAEIAAMPSSISAEAKDIKSGIDEISKTAHDLFPQAKLQRIHFSTSVDGTYQFIMRQPGEIRKTSGSTQLWISSHNGEVVAIQKPQSMSTGDTFINWMFPLHNGEAFGLAGRIVVFVAGICLIILYITGLMVWWRKSQAKGGS